MAQTTRCNALPTRRSSDWPMQHPPAQLLPLRCSASSCAHVARLVMHAQHSCHASPVGLALAATQPHQLPRQPAAQRCKVAGCNPLSHPPQTWCTHHRWHCGRHRSLLLSQHRLLRGHHLPMHGRAPAPAAAAGWRACRAALPQRRCQRRTSSSCLRWLWSSGQGQAPPSQMRPHCWPRWPRCGTACWQTCLLLLWQGSRR